MDADRIDAALSELGPEERALLELSLVREVADTDIAELLGADESAVRLRREDALAGLAASLGISSSEQAGELVRELRGLPQVRWRRDRRRQAADPAPKRKRNRAALVLVLLVLGAAAAVGIALAGGGGENERQPVTSTATPAPRPQAHAMPRKLRPVAGSQALGTAYLVKGRLTLSASNLPNARGGGYVVWLYDSLSRARPLIRPRANLRRVRVVLPEDASSYEFVDVSVEPADGNDNHSGQSVLRVPLKSLR